MKLVPFDRLLSVGASAAWGRATAKLPGSDAFKPPPLRAGLTPGGPSQNLSTGPHYSESLGSAGTAVAHCRRAPAHATKAPSINQELLMGFEPMNLVLTKDALYQLSYSSIICLPAKVARSSQPRFALSAAGRKLLAAAGGYRRPKLAVFASQPFSGQPLPSQSG